MPYKDPEARRAAQLRWYHKHKDERAEQLAKIRRDTVERRYAVVLEAKDTPCMDCGIQYPIPVMEFDHREGETKLGGIANMVTRKAPEDAIRAEIAKCDVVCANCHRLRTARRAGWRLDRAA